MPRWLNRAVALIRERAATRKVRFTLKARRELAALELGLDESDACDLLAKLTPGESVGRVLTEETREWMYAFKPSLAETTLYVKIILRNECIVISFHEDASDEREDA